MIGRDWLPKFATGLNMKIGCSSKSIWVIKLSFSQNDPLIGESFWQNNSLVTYILFELQPIIIFSPVANFGDQSLLTIKWRILRRQLNIMHPVCIFCGFNVFLSLSHSQRQENQMGDKNLCEKQISISANMSTICSGSGQKSQTRPLDAFWQVRA